MRLSKDGIKQRYEDADPRTIEFLCNVLDDIKKDNKELNNYFLCSFDLLKNQLELYYAAVDDISKAGDITSEDAYKRKAKSPSIMIMQKCHDQIMKILNEFSMSPFGQARLKRVQTADDQSAEEILNKLIE